MRIGGAWRGGMVALVSWQVLVMAVAGQETTETEGTGDIAGTGDTGDTGDTGKVEAYFRCTDKDILKSGERGQALRCALRCAKDKECTGITNDDEGCGLLHGEDAERGCFKEEEEKQEVDLQVNVQFALMSEPRLEMVLNGNIDLVLTAQYEHPPFLFNQNNGPATTMFPSLVFDEERRLEDLYVLDGHYFLIMGSEVDIYREGGTAGSGLLELATTKTSLGEEYGTGAPGYAVAAAVNHQSRHVFLVSMTWPDHMVYEYAIDDASNPLNITYSLVTSYDIQTSNSANLFRPDLANTDPVPITTLHGLAFVKDALVMLDGIEMRVLNFTTNTWEVVGGIGDVIVV